MRFRPARGRRGFRRALLASALLVTGLPFASPRPAVALPGGFQISTVLTGLSSPTAVRFAADGRMFIAEKSGLIKVYDNVADTTATIFADLSTNVYNYLDRGLLGIELHPNFPATPYVYALYTYDADIGGTAPKWGTPGVLSDPCPDPPGATTNGCVVSARLTRLEADGNTMTGGERVLVEDWCQQFPSHSIGTVEFGPDGALYAGAGDGALSLDWGQKGDPVNPCGDPPGGVGGSMTPPSAEGGSFRSQDLRTPDDPTTLDGTIIRVDPATGAALPDNPLASSPDPNARRIIAYGLRNPFRWTFRPGTSEIFLGDVGEQRVEEIDRIPNPTDATVENFGWPCYEGNPRNAPFDNRDFTICEQMYGTPAASPTFFEYGHSLTLYPADPCPAGGGVISAMAFYEGGDYPDVYDGALFFGDYQRRCIWVMLENANGEIDPSTVTAFASADVGYPVDLQVGPGGDLFFIDVGYGRLRRIRYFSSDQPPVAQVAANPTSGPAPLEVAFDGTGSTDPEGGALTYEWDLDGDGQYDDSTAPSPTHVYTAPGVYEAGLRVTDSQGARSSAAVTISAGNTAPSPTIVQPASGFTWHVGEEVAFAGEATDAEDGALPPEALDWSIILHHCPNGVCHTHAVQDFVDTASGAFHAGDHEYPSHLELSLTATDSAGLTASTSVLLHPETVDVTLASSPAGLQLGFGSATQTAPFTATAVVGSTISLTAPSPQTLAGDPYAFVSWSDGGAQTHDITIGSSPATYSAAYDLATLIDVAVGDNGYTPRNLTGGLPQTVRWTNNGTRDHTVTDNSGLALYDSGALAPGARFSFEYFASGRYSYRSTLDSFTGSVTVPMLRSPASGTTSTILSLTWASRTPPEGYVHDVQIQRPGTTSWVSWRTATTTTGGLFMADAGTGTYQFRARIRRPSNGRAAAWSVLVGFTVG